MAKRGAVKRFGRPKKPTAAAHRKWYRFKKAIRSIKKSLDLQITEDIKVAERQRPRRRQGEGRQQKEKEEKEISQQFHKCLAKQLSDRRSRRPRRKRRSRRSAQRAWKRKRRKELAWSKIRDKYWDDKAELEIQFHQKQIKHQYGFLADPSKELWENIKDYYGNMSPRTYLIGRPTNMACHDLCIDQKAPPGIELLLGLGATYCVQQPNLSKKASQRTMKRLRRNV